MKDKLINNMLDDIKERNTNTLAIKFYNEVNIVDFLDSISIETIIPPKESLNISKEDTPKLPNDSIGAENMPKKEHSFPISTEELYFLIQNTDINKLGSHSNNKYKSLCELLDEHWKYLAKDIPTLLKIIELVGEKTDFTQKNGYKRTYLELALTRNVLRDQGIHKSVDMSDPNHKAYLSETTALENFLEIQDIRQRLVNYDYRWTGVILGKTNYFIDRFKTCADVIDLSFKHKNELPRYYMEQIRTIAKPKYVEQNNFLSLIEQTIIQGRKKELFNEEELKSFIDNYFDKDFSVNIFNKKEKYSQFAEKGNLIISLVKHIKNLPSEITTKISEVESLPSSNTAQINQNKDIHKNTTDNMDKNTIEHKNILQLYEKIVSDNVINYLIEKADINLKNSSDLTREKTTISKMILEVRNSILGLNKVKVKR